MVVDERGKERENANNRHFYRQHLTLGFITFYHIFQWHVFIICSIENLVFDFWLINELKNFTALSLFRAIFGGGKFRR